MESYRTRFYVSLSLISCLFFPSSPRRQREGEGGSDTKQMKKKTTSKLVEGINSIGSLRKRNDINGMYVTVTLCGRIRKCNDLSTVIKMNKQNAQGNTQTTFFPLTLSLFALLQFCYIVPHRHRWYVVREECVCLWRWWVVIDDVFPPRGLYTHSVHCTWNGCERQRFWLAFTKIYS